jgi:hypothetical protein
MTATQRTRLHGARAIFWLHAFTAVYCVSAAFLEGFHLLSAWLSPNILVFYALLLSVGLFPLAAALFIRGSSHPHRGAVEFAHVLMSLVQFIGLLHGVA